MPMLTKITKSALSLAATIVVVSASAAVQFEAGSMENAGSTAGSTDTFQGMAESDAFSGESNAVMLEALDAGVAWTSFTLTLRTSDDVPRAVPVSFAGLAGVLSVRDDDTAIEGVRNQGWTYTYAFSGTLPAGVPLTLIVDEGFSGLYEGNAVLRALASDAVSVIPEPGAPALMLAGLGALAFIWRRRQR